MYIPTCKIGHQVSLAVQWVCPWLPRVTAVSSIKGEERVSNAAYGSGEHCWESNVTFSVTHVSTTVPSFTSQALVHTPVSTIRVQLQRQSIP